MINAPKFPQSTNPAPPFLLLPLLLLLLLLVLPSPVQSLSQRSTFRAGGRVSPPSLLPPLRPTQHLNNYTSQKPPLNKVPKPPSSGDFSKTLNQPSSPNQPSEPDVLGDAFGEFSVNVGTVVPTLILTSLLLSLLLPPCPP